MSITPNFFSAVALVALVGLTRSASAQPAAVGPPTTWSVQVEGPCSEVPGFEQGLLDAIPSNSRAPADSAEMRIRVVTNLPDGGGQAQVEVFDAILQAPAGSRTLASNTPGCAALAAQLQLVVGILVEAGRGAPAPKPPEPEPEPAPEPEPEPEPEPQETQPAPVQRVRRLRVGPRRHYTFGLVATLGWGYLPRAYPGSELRWSIAAGDRWPIRIAGGFQGPSEAETASGAMRLLSGYASIGTCPEWALPPFHVGGCMLLGLGATRADNVSFVSGEHKRSPLVTLGLEAFITAQIAGAWELVVGVQAAGVPFLPQFAYRTRDGVDVVAHEVEPVIVRGHGGLQLRFP